MLSALQLHRKTIKFQKPDTTQGGITFKARCYLHEAEVMWDAEMEVGQDLSM